MALVWLRQIYTESILPDAFTANIVDLHLKNKKINKKSPLACHTPPVFHTLSPLCAVLHCKIIDSNTHPWIRMLTMEFWPLWSCCFPGSFSCLIFLFMCFELFCGSWFYFLSFFLLLAFLFPWLDVDWFHLGLVCLHCHALAHLQLCGARLPWSSHLHLVCVVTESCVEPRFSFKKPALALGFLTSCFTFIVSLLLIRN